LKPGMKAVLDFFLDLILMKSSQLSPNVANGALGTLSVFGLLILLTL